ncbi:MAG TPA: aldo/keto reductase [Candidatus Scatomorpha merdigallinarum]|nr:aldo/keto reductase [Candidatus Scatomorpha merdigallinarum]
MEYRKLPRGDEMVSVLGLGNSSMGESGEYETEASVSLALENGINYFDMATADATPFAAFGRAVGSMREKVYYQVHFGALYDTGTYGWTLELDAIKRSVDWQLRQLRSDYIDFGFIHCIDENEDLDTAISEGTVDYLRSLKNDGTVRYIGMSTHTPAAAMRALDMGLLDVLMFSINPAYDYKRGEYGIGSVDERMELYRRCERDGVGISVMKPFAGGQLLNARTSPFKKALSEYQCLQYALDKPGVMTVLPGVRNREDLRRLLGFFEAGESERDYSVIASFTPAEAEGVCVYCNHCQPCPAGLDVGLINKYYDLARAGDALARDHYMHLARHASDCLHCGHCDSRCPFHAKQSERMSEIESYFGE